MRQTHGRLPTLDEIGIKFQTDKSSQAAYQAGAGVRYSVHNYLDKYEPLMAPFRNREICLCEIGIGGGASLRMWKEYFPNAIIHGIDIRPMCKDYEEERINIHILDGESVNTKNYLLENVIVPHILIEDGSHSFRGQKTALETLFPLIPAGGYYIVEDLSVGMAAYLRRRTENMHLSDDNIIERERSLRELSTAEQYIELNTDMICFVAQFACIIRKKPYKPAHHDLTIHMQQVQKEESLGDAYLKLTKLRLPALAVCDGDIFIGIVTPYDINKHDYEALSKNPVVNFCNKNPRILPSTDAVLDDGFLYHPVVDESGRFLGFKYEF